MPISKNIAILIGARFYNNPTAIINFYRNLPKKIIISHSNINDENFFEEVNKTLYDLLKYKREAKLFVTLTKEADELNTISSKNSIEMIDDAILSFIKERLSWAIEKGYVKKCDPDLCAFIIYKVYVAVMFEWDKEIDGKPYDEVVKIAKEYIESVGGFEKFAEWGLY